MRYGVSLMGYVATWTVTSDAPELGGAQAGDKIAILDSGMIALFHPLPGRARVAIRAAAATGGAARCAKPRRNSDAAEQWRVKAPGVDIGDSAGCGRAQDLVVFWRNGRASVVRSVSHHDFVRSIIRFDLERDASRPPRLKLLRNDLPNLATLPVQ